MGTAGTEPAAGEEEGEAAKEARAERKEESLGSWEQRRGKVGRKGIGGAGGGEEGGWSEIGRAHV